MNRWFWILMIYVRRPLNWLLVTMLLACCLFVSQFRSAGYQDVAHGIQSDAVASFFSPRRRITSQRDLKAVLENPSDTPVAVDLGLLARDFEFGELKTMDDGTEYRLGNVMDDAEARMADIQLPENVHWLTTGTLMCKQATIDQIGSIESIKQLELHFADDQQNSLDLSPLARLHHLERLELKLFAKVESLSSLGQLRNLKTLIIGNHQLVTDDNLRAIGSFQSLEELYLPDISYSPIAMEAVKQLKVSNSLDRVYLAVPMTKRETLSTIAASLGDIDVRPSKYLPMQTYVFIGVLFAIMLLNSLGSLVSAQFTLPMAQLAPAYKATHWQFTSAIYLGLVATGALLLWNVSVHPSLAILLVATTLLGSLAIGLTPQAATPTFVQHFQGLAFVATLFAAVGWVSLMPLHAQHILGSPPWLLLVGLSLAAGCFALKLFWSLQTSCRDRIEVGNAPILSFHDMQQRGEKQLLRSSKGLDPYTRMSKWCCIAGYIALAMVLIWKFAFAGQPSPMFSRSAILLMPMFVVWSFMAIGIKSWRKIPFQASMMIRPPGRRVQVKQIFIDVAADFGWTIPMMVAAALMASHGMAKLTEAPVESMIAMAILALGILAMAYAITMWTLTVRSLLGIIVDGLTAFVACNAMVFATVTTMFSFDEGNLEAVVLIPALAVTGGLFVIVAALATFFIWRTYLKLEWGHYLR